ncbi:restriction endonuclease subunit S [Verrucomicrobiales bacterium]|nr:restriction endonuclease subunit S [Verrucomicrobiales bacterium]
MNTDAPTSIADQVEAQIDRSQWRSFKFSDLAENINEKISPKNSDLTHYIGLEHLDSGSLKIRRFGDPKAIKGDKLKIYKGDLIFAKRNAYLKRVSIAEFDAIASAHSMVLRARPENVIPEFLPFFLLSDTFWERAISISVGSLSPTINWKALAKQEFLLPPKDQQAKLAELLWAADKAVERAIATHMTCETTFRALEKKCFDHQGKVHEKLLNIATVKRGKFSHRPRNEPRFYGGDIPFIQTSEVVDSQKFIQEYSQTLNEEGLKISKMFPKGTIVMTIAANIGYVGILDFDSAFTDSLVGVWANEEKVLQEYLFYYLNYNQPVLDRLAPESAQKNLSIDTMDSFDVYFPEKKINQSQIIEKLDLVLDSIKTAANKVKSSQQLLKSLINQIF